MADALHAARGQALLLVLLALLLLVGAVLYYRTQLAWAEPKPAGADAASANAPTVRAAFSAAPPAASPAEALASRPAPARQPTLDDVPRLDRRLSVTAAYAQIPHRRTAFGQESDTAASAAGMTRAERAYLKRLFAAADQGVVLRVESAQTRLNDTSMEARMEADRGYPALLAFFEALTPPPRLAVAHQQLVDAVRLQQDFFNEWDSGTGTPDIAQHPMVRTSSDRLRSAYSALMTSFPDVSSHNRQAFFDHFCALDFI